jgi:DNA-binding winged helix-turn-helix (wHTH) protein/TolB-like protein
MQRGFQFGNFRLRPDEHVLLRGERENISLAPKAFDLLVLLVKNNGHLLTRDELLRAIWPDSFVEESNLTVNISLLRKVLGNAEDGQPFIQTVPKKGYRFVGEVTVQCDDGASVLPASSQLPSAMPETGAPGPLAQASTAVVEPPRDSVVAQPRMRWRAWSLLALALIGLAVFLAIRFVRANRKVSPAAALARRNLAVMPFQNLKHDPDTDFLGFALADAVINKLGYVSELTVRPSYSVVRYASQPAEPRQVARELGVNTMLTGTYIRDGDSLRISAQLIDPETQRLIWHDTMDVKFNNLLDVQDSVTQKIVSGLSLQLSPQEAEHLAGAKGSDPRAYEYYLRGVDLYASGNFKEAIKMLETSAQLDSRSAQTWAMVGRAYTTNASVQFGGSEAYRKAQEAYEKSLALDPAQIVSRVYMANLLTDTGRPERAVPLLKEALSVNPNFAEADWELSYAYRFGGLLNESVELAERARTLDPSVKLNTSAINAYLYLGEYDRFLNSLPSGESDAYTLFYRGFAEYHLGRRMDAQRDFNRAYELDPTLLQTRIGKALSLSSESQSKKGLELLRATEAQLSQSGVRDPEAMYKLAEAYAVLGDKDRALQMMRHSIESGFFCYPYFVRDPLLESIRSEPQFSELMHTARHRYEEFQRSFTPST